MHIFLSNPETALELSDNFLLFYLLSVYIYIMRKIKPNLSNFLFIFLGNDLSLFKIFILAPIFVLFLVFLQEINIFTCKISDFMYIIFSKCE